ncbi:MAG: short-chain fatty acyl-CoA regulator family protein [Polyangiaceae bacterium]
MDDAVKLGGKVRVLRRRDGISQAELAQRLGISPSYLNLIESNKRALTAALLLRLAQIFKVDIGSFASEDDNRLAADLAEVFVDPMFEPHDLTNVDVRELANGSPNMARATLTLYRAYVAARDATHALANRLSEDEASSVDRPDLPTEEVSDFIQRHKNHFAPIEDAAADLWREARLDADDVYAGLVQHMTKKLGIRVKVVRVGDERKAMRRYDPKKKIVGISEVLPPRSRRFQVAHQLGLLSLSSVFDEIVHADKDLTTSEARALARVVLANYFASAVLMPYEPFLEAARAERYDIELLAHRFGASFEQVCHRLTSLGRKGREGVPFHMLRIDMAGNISKRFSNSGIRIARFSGACPRWNIHSAFLTPGMIRVQISRMPDGAIYFCLARTLRSDRGGYNVPHTVHAIGMGCDIRYARELVYSDGVDLASIERGDHQAVVPVGVTCRLCEHLDCAQRAFPPLLHPLRVEENVRGVSFYAPVPSE